LEDPVEFHMDGVTQVAINEKVGLTFASSLRACLRQDPDIICVGEIRDGETAEIAMRAAMTGHLVLSTIHTEDTISAIDRLKDLGVEPYLIASSLRGVISQRLVRKICPKCRKEVSPNLYDAENAGITHPEKFHFYKGTGCPMCFGTGYRSRTGVFEILTMDARVREAISKGANSTELRKVIIQRADFTSMLANARGLIETGVTTVEEVVRQVVSID
ncbi:MAG: ATPase, T2SS/T4P/T4SS family, partial [Bulleidia sp.]|nr:ATPase, T2SS/T4P/T4SS family [Bulleidia sp.]